MAKTKYTAKFSNGSEATRGSERTYSHAWRIVFTARGAEHVKTGFARTEALARACQAKEGPAEWDTRTGRWKADPSRLISFEVVPVEIL